MEQESVRTLHYGPELLSTNTELYELKELQVERESVRPFTLLLGMVLCSTCAQLLGLH